MAERKFKIMSHTADIGIVAGGGDMKTAFENAAKGMFSIITDRRKVRSVIRREAAVSAPDREMLLVAWLNELVYLFDTRRFLGKRFEITELTDTSLKATIYGEDIDPSRHEIRIGIKAVTYHMLRVSEAAGRWQVRVIFDI
jgi:SHS2 domain-containing protein